MWYCRHLKHSGSLFLHYFDYVFPTFPKISFSYIVVQILENLPWKVTKFFLFSEVHKSLDLSPPNLFALAMTLVRKRVSIQTASSIVKRVLWNIFCTIELWISTSWALPLLEARLSVCYDRHFKITVAHEKAWEDCSKGGKWVQILHEEGSMRQKRFVRMCVGLEIKTIY